MTAPITPDERAAMRALADRMETYYGEADAASGIRRLLDALDRAEAEVARLRGPHPCCEHCPEDPVHDVAPDEHEVPCPSCEADSLLGRARRERDEARAEVARLREEAARPAPVWDEDTVTEAVARAMFPHYFTDNRQPLRVFTETRSDTELREAERESARHRARQALAVVREHLPVRPDRETARYAGGRAYAEGGGPWDVADAVLDLWPGESRVTVQAEALRDAAAALDLPGSTAALGYYASEQVAGYTLAERDIYVWLRARADRLDPKETDRG